MMRWPTLAVLCAAMACRATAAPSRAGRYALRTVDGVALPATVAGFRVERGAITLHEDSTFVDVLTYAGGTDSLLGTVRALTPDTLLFDGGWTVYRVAVAPDGALTDVWAGAVFRYAR